MSFVGSRRAKCRVLSAENCHFETHRLQFTGLLGNSGVTLRSLRRLVNWPKKCIDFGYPLVALTRAVAFSLCTKPTMLNDAVRCVGGIDRQQFIALCVFSVSNSLDPFRRGSEPLRCVVDAERSSKQATSALDRRVAVAMQNRYDILSLNQLDSTRTRRMNRTPSHLLLQFA